MLITEEYRELNRQLHGSNENYGKFSSKWAEPVMGLCMRYDTTDVLDYGCGKGSLNLHLPFSVNQYDPAVPKWSKDPLMADIVVCTDVLEHIEPDCVIDVLDDLRRLTMKVGLFNIATRPAVKTLADGRNAHVSVHEPEWWQEKLEARFVIIDRHDEKGEATFLVEKLP